MNEKEKERKMNERKNERRKIRERERERETCYWYLLNFKSGARPQAGRTQIWTHLITIGMQS